MDRNGHPAGDQALRAFARVLQGAIRDGDTAARYGGEEFVVMLPGTNAADALVVDERIRSQVEATTIDLSPGHRDQLTVSIGVAALYRAKNAGRNRVVLAGAEFRERRASDEAAGEPAPEPIFLARAG